MRSPSGFTAMLLATVTVGVLAAGCSKRPDYLSRDDSVDELCKDGKQAYTYDIEQKDAGKAATKIPDDAIGAGCEAPTAAWTDYRDLQAGGARKKAYHLRVDAGRTILCCK